MAKSCILQTKSNGLLKKTSLEHTKVGSMVLMKEIPFVTIENWSTVHAIAKPQNNYPKNVEALLSRQVLLFPPLLF